MSKKKKKEKKSVDVHVVMNGGESPFGQSVNTSSDGWEPDKPYALRVQDRIKELYAELEKLHVAGDRRDDDFP